MYYPTPRDLLRPFVDIDGRRRYDFKADAFQLFHFTYLGCQVVIRQVRNQYVVSCRGWMPHYNSLRRKANDLIRYDNSWTDISFRSYLSDAVVDFRSCCQELLSLSDSDLKQFNFVGRSV